MTEDGATAVLLEQAEGDAKELIPQSALDAVDLSLPGEYRLEVMADELLGVLGTFHRAQAGRRAARNSENHKEAERLGEMVGRMRLIAAVITMDVPGVKAVADRMATYRAKRARAERDTALDKGKD